MGLLTDAGWLGARPEASIVLIDASTNSLALELVSANAGISNDRVDAVLAIAQVRSERSVRDAVQCAAGDFCKEKRKSSALATGAK